MISYKPFQKLLIDRDITKAKVRCDLKLSSATIAKLNGNGYVSLSVIDKLCNYLECSVPDLLEFKSINKPESEAINYDK